MPPISKKTKTTKTKAETPPVVETPVPAAEAKRSAGIRWRSGCGKFFILAITNGSTSEYLVRWLASRGGLRFFTLTKMEILRETTYYTSVPREGTEDHSCGCDGHRQHHHCKHVEALMALRDQKKL